MSQAVPEPPRRSLSLSKGRRTLRQAQRPAALRGYSARDAADRGMVEGVAGRALGGALTVEVGRCPAVDERPPGTEDQAEVDVLDGRHDALLEHDRDLLRETVLHAVQDLRLRRRR